MNINKKLINFYCFKGEVVCVCTSDFDPICCDGQLYPNSCEAECDGIDDPDNSDQCREGFCYDTPCELDYNPLCCYGKDYINSCHAEHNGVPKPAENFCLEGRC